ncbi:unnamed protein product [Effrenium voratum]|uniref:Uncharacterized protein n=1 Tax=Effrenium voratum TaxID=2562239 RepID=A0AA36NCT6_9DINO|nr:unnamed protein product [Effrenium voratum]
MAGWISELKASFGWQFLLTIFYYHHVMKGFVLMYVYTSFDWVMASHHVRGPRLQALKTAALLPWVLKPILGIASDMFPICGKSKAPYIIMATLVGCPACCFIGCHEKLDMSHELKTSAAVSAFFCVGVQICTCDLLLEAVIAERVRKSPGQGPSLMAFANGGQTAGEAFAILTVGWALERYGPHGPCLLAVPLTFLALVPAMCNWLDEPLRGPEESQQRRRAFFSSGETGGEIPFLVAAMGLGSLVILYVATNTDDSIRGDPLDLTAATYQLKLILLVAFGILAASLCLLNPTIGLMNAFFVLQSTSTISVDGGAFYFFTDDSSSYPMGPHFSVWFYTTGLGMAASAFGIFGLWIYNRYMSDWTYRGLLIISNLLWSLVSLLSVLEFTRRNRDLLGIPDTAFVLIATVLQSMVSRWAYVPGGLLLCQVCPEGLESTMFALLGGCHNLGRAVASILGTYLLAFLGVEPDGTQHDRHCFDRLWMAAVLQALAPLVTLCLIPRMIPDASQTDPLRLSGGPVAGTGGMEDSDPKLSISMATRGSLWRSFISGGVEQAGSSGASPGSGGPAARMATYGTQADSTGGSRLAAFYQRKSVRGPDLLSMTHWLQ